MERSSDGAGTGSITHHPWPDFCSTVPCFAGPHEVKGERGLGQQADVFVFRPTDRTGNKLMSRPGFSGAADGKIRCVETLAREHRVRTGGGGGYGPPEAALSSEVFQISSCVFSAKCSPPSVRCSALHPSQLCAAALGEAARKGEQRQGVRRHQAASGRQTTSGRQADSSNVSQRPDAV